MAATSNRSLREESPAMNTDTAYEDFTERLKILIKEQRELIKTTLGNVFTMRLIGNKTHGDLAEIAIAEFVNQYMYDFSAVHVGKDLYRAKSQEEDIKIKNKVNGLEFSISLKAYGDGPLQLSTDKSFSMFPRLEREPQRISSSSRIKKILNDPAFAEFSNINVLPLIYNEKEKLCNILVFDCKRALASTVRITREEAERRRKHPVYRFYDKDDGYICEVRYGDAAANALQRGLWTHTKNGIKYFKSITNGWISYSHNPVLVELFSHALVSSKRGHTTALKKIKHDITLLKQRAELQ